MRSVRPLLVPCADLREGMIVHRDVHSRAGALLVPRGTCLTERTIERLRALLTDLSSIEVTQPNIAM